MCKFVLLCDGRSVMFGVRWFVVCVLVWCGYVYVLVVLCCLVCVRCFGMVLCCCVLLCVLFCFVVFVLRGLVRVC